MSGGYIGGSTDASQSVGIQCTLGGCAHRTSGSGAVSISTIIGTLERPL